MANGFNKPKSLSELPNTLTIIAATVMRPECDYGLSNNYLQSDAVSERSSGMSDPVAEEVSAQLYAMGRIPCVVLVVSLNG